MEMIHFDIIQTSLLLALLLLFLVPPLLILWLYLKNMRQTQHSLLRGKYWFMGILRYMIESVGPEFRFYITDGDNNGRPISREKYVSIVKAAKYMKTLISYGSKRDFNEPGFFIKNSMFPKLGSELEVDNQPMLSTKRYVTNKETLFFRYESRDEVDVYPWYLKGSDAKTVGAGRKKPWLLKGLVGMSAMSYGALGKNAIITLSKGIAMAGGSWMNTGEGGLSKHHLAGGCDIVFQIGPGMFGIRDTTGNIDWDKLKGKSEIKEIRAFELKLGQGAKIRGGHVEGEKVTKDIAEMRGVPVGKNIDSPNRFEQVSDTKSLFDFVEQIQECTGKPVGIKIVIGDNDSLNEFCEEFKKRGRGPDFITVDGAEGGTGATYKEMADMLGLPIYQAIAIADKALRSAGIRDKIKIFASGKLQLPEEIAVALCLGADFVNIARGFMIAIGCIMTLKCHNNHCPVGVATTDPKMQRSLFIDEKKYRVMNYIITIRAGLFHLSGACGLAHPDLFSREQLVFKENENSVINLNNL